MFSSVKNIHFVGIGGIGMSGIAEILINQGFSVSGSDLAQSENTDYLASLGAKIYIGHKAENINPIETDVVVYSSAVHINENPETLEAQRLNIPTLRRAEMLAEVSRLNYCLAISGTHGKTTTTSMLGLTLIKAGIDPTVIVGGRLRGLGGTNARLGQGQWTVVEADEYDRSFHQLDPLMAVITSVEADHLDIYGDLKTMTEAYDVFCGKIRPGGLLLLNHRIRDRLKHPEDVSVFTYGNDPGADYRYFNVVSGEDYYLFSLSTPEGMIENLRFHFPGRINIENLTAAIAIALKCGVSETEIRRSVPLFKGVRRRFDIRVNMPGLTYIDDYAHHPGEIKACIRSLREYFGGRRITGIFQPHLFSRTRDHADEFAEILDELDEAILLPIYPAREKPIEGVSSELIFERMKLENKKMLQPQNVVDMLDPGRLDVLVTIGAGDIHRLVDPIERKLRGENPEK